MAYQMVLLPHSSLRHPNVEGTCSEGLSVLAPALFREGIRMFLRQLVPRRIQFQYRCGCLSSSRTMKHMLHGSCKVLLIGETIL